MKSRTAENAKIAKLAREARGFLYFTGPDAKGQRSNAWLRKSDAPEWVEKLCLDACESIIDDIRYAQIVWALDALVDADGDEDNIGEYRVDVYTGVLTAWLASNVRRVSFCDDAVEELDVESKVGIIERIQMGQVAEMREVLNSVIRSLRDRMEEVGDEDETEEDEEDETEEDETDNG